MFMVTLCTAILASLKFCSTLYLYSKVRNQSILNSRKGPYLFPLWIKHYFNFLLSILFSLQQLTNRPHCFCCTIIIWWWWWSWWWWGVCVCTIEFWWIHLCKLFVRVFVCLIESICLSLYVCTYTYMYTQVHICVYVCYV